jgi:hypothetical protein
MKQKWWTEWRMQAIIRSVRFIAMRIEGPGMRASSRLNPIGSNS